MYIFLTVMYVDFCWFCYFMIVWSSGVLHVCIIHMHSCFFILRHYSQKQSEVVRHELCVCSVQAMEAEASYKACIQAANSTREQLDQVKVVCRIVDTYLYHFTKLHLCMAVLAMSEMSVCLSVHLSVCQMCEL